MPAPLTLRSLALRCTVLGGLLATLACSDSAPPRERAAGSAPALTSDRPRAVGNSVRDAARAVDPGTGLVVDPRMPLVVANCTACHSARLVVQNRGTRRDWEERLRWMQKNHNLWALEPDVRSDILDYLSEHYPPDAPAAGLRRPPLSEPLMPPTRSELDPALPAPRPRPGVAS